MNLPGGDLFGQLLEEFEDGETKSDHGKRGTNPWNQRSFRRQHGALDGQVGPIFGQL
jgi:hypothetical protein